MGTTISPPIPGPQFQTTDGQISNLDRCNRCGTPRSSHGLDWSCPPEMQGSVRLFLVAAGLSMVIGGGIVWVASGRTGMLNTLAAVALALGFALLVAGSVMPSQEGATPERGTRDIYHSAR